MQFFYILYNFSYTVLVFKQTIIFKNPLKYNSIFTHKDKNKNQVLLNLVKIQTLFISIFNLKHLEYSTLTIKHQMQKLNATKLKKNHKQHLNTAKDIFGNLT